MKPKCDDKEWMHCRVEKMGCDGCHYEDREEIVLFADGEEIQRKEYFRENYKLAHKGEE